MHYWSLQGFSHSWFSGLRAPLQSWTLCFCSLNTVSSHISILSRPSSIVDSSLLFSSSSAFIHFVLVFFFVSFYPLVISLICPLFIPISPFPPLPAICCTSLDMFCPYPSPLCSPSLLMALCRCRIRQNNMTHREGLNSHWFTSQYQTGLCAEP